MNHDETRRRFLTLVAGAPLLLACSSGAMPSAPIGVVSAGNLKDLPSGTVRVVGSQAVAIGRDEGGVYAMTLTCTHEGCNIASEGTVAATGIRCGCHGSRFDANGAVTHGPANAPLQHYAVSVDAEGEVTIHGDTPVDATTRAKV